MTSGGASAKQTSEKKQSKSDIEELMEQAKATSKRQGARSIEDEAAEKKTSPSSSKFAKIDQNAFFKIMFDADATPKEKMAAVTKTLTFSESKEDANARLEEFKQFKEYLQFERKRMAQQIIELTDTEAFSELKEVYDELNNALLSFEDKINPLTEIVDAVYELRMNGLTFDVFKEITLDKEAEARIAALRAEQEKKLAELEDHIKRINHNVAKWSEDRSFFGLGGIRQPARERIATAQLELKEHETELNALIDKMKDESLYQLPQSELDEQFLESKAKLRELLDISSDEHKQRQTDLVTAAQHFVNTTEERVSGISEHFDGMDKQIDNLMDANYSMREIYAILNDATKEAHEKNEKTREKLEPEDSAESDIEKMNREREKRDLENYIGALNASSVDTTSVFAELTNAGHRIKSMKDGNDQQIAKTRQLHSSGVAGVADQLSTVLQAVSAAALGESSEMARMSLERMNQKTTDLSQKEVIRIALGTHEQNSDLSKALEGLEQYGEVIRTATTITREGLEETKDLLGKLEAAAKDVQEDVKESIAVAAEVVAGKSGGDNDDDAQDLAADADGAPDPFNINKG
ncbi:MAG: hypothetical protein HND56_02755 [Pseudomonadota bacterium]|nr:hypothetical protein [Pseudomonadota bacterium]QKK04671.1 MAG: hypothetical protein HND56_02755 [Pseudomonadota bacterium]